MKVITDNHNLFPRVITCENCKSELEFEEADCGLIVMASPQTNERLVQYGFIEGNAVISERRRVATKFHYNLFCPCCNHPIEDVLVKSKKVTNE